MHCASNVHHRQFTAISYRWQPISLALARPVEAVRQPPAVERVDVRLQVLAMPLVCGEVARAATFQGLVLAGQRVESGSKFQESWISVFGHGGA